MSLYREAGRRRTLPLLAGAVAIAVAAGLIGFLIGDGGEEDPSLADAVESVREEVQPAFSELELVTIEYTEAVRDGRVVAETEYQAALDHADRASATIAGASGDLELLGPDRLAAAEAAMSELSELVEGPAPAADVEAAVRRAEGALRALTGLAAPPS
jgi:hypothetical protein